MKKYVFFRNRTLHITLWMIIVPFCLNAQNAPGWVNNLENAFPGRDWIAVTAQGNSQSQAESNAMNALARAFRTDVASLTQASQQFTQIVNNSQNSVNVNFNESSNFSQEINTSSNIRGLIGVQIEVFRTGNTFYVCARMNRRESAARYSGMIRENSVVIGNLLANSGQNGTFETYARLSFAHALAQVTDNFQNILEVLDPSAANRRPAYGGANAVRTRMQECASLITVAVAFDTEQPSERTLLARAAGAFFRDRGFRINEQGQGNYILRANVRFEGISQNVISCRYYFDAVLENSAGTAVFSFTENDRRAHPNSVSEARRLAVQGVENSIKEARFASEFDSWLNSFLD